MIGNRVRRGHRRSHRGWAQLLLNLRWHSRYSRPPMIRALPTRNPTVFPVHEPGVEALADVQRLEVVASRPGPVEPGHRAISVRQGYLS